MAGMKSGYPLGACKSPGAAVYVGQFVTNGASAPTLIEGQGFTVSAPATGLYTVTLTDGPVAGVYFANAGLEPATAAASTSRAMIASTAAITTAGTFQILTQSTAGTDADLAVGSSVNFLLIVRNTSITRRG